MRTRGPTLRHRAELVRTLGPPLAPGDVVLDLACGDGGLADYLPEQRYVGVDASELMVAAGRSRARELTRRRPERLCAAAAGAGDDDLSRDLLRARPSRALRSGSRATPRRSSSSTSTRASMRSTMCVADLRRAGFDHVDTRPFFVPQTRALPFLQALERSGPLARLAAPLPLHPDDCGVTPGGSFLKKR